MDHKLSALVQIDLDVGSVRLLLPSSLTGHPYTPRRQPPGDRRAGRTSRAVPTSRHGRGDRT